MNINAPTAIFSATSSLFSKFGLFSFIPSKILSTDFFIKSSKITTSPFLVKFLLSLNLTNPNPTFIQSFAHWYSNNSKTLNICLKYNDSGASVTYIHL